MAEGERTGAADAAEHVARNARQLREARGLTQKRMAELAGMPRATWAHLETGGGNPTLAVLVKAAAALHVTLEELVAPPPSMGRKIPASELPTRTRGGVVVRKLLPESLPGLEVERMALAPGARMTGIPHTPGTREYLTCESGRLELSESGTIWQLEPGDVVAFRGDQKHGYRNPGREPAVAYSAVVLGPTR